MRLKLAIVSGAAAMLFLLLVACGAAKSSQTSSLAKSSQTRSLMKEFSSCPMHDPRPTTSTRVSTMHTLVASGARLVLLCEYGGTKFVNNGPTVVTVHQAAITKSALIRHLAQALNSLKPASGSKACPTGSRLQYFIEFRYANRPADIVRINLLGCGSVQGSATSRVFEVSGKLLHTVQQEIRGEQ